MRLNEHTQIVGGKVILVSYEAKHVPKYHEWMKSPELQQLTASEPLSLDEEFAMQQSWRNDADKLTFLVLCRQTYDQTKDEISALVGDTNLFFRLADDEVEHQEEPQQNNQKIAEAEIMIAETAARGKGYGWEAMLLMFKYAIAHIKELQGFEVKIGMDNEKSIRMFQKMQFVEVSRSTVFEEVTMQRNVTEDWLKWLDQMVELKSESYL